MPRSLRRPTVLVILAHLVVLAPSSGGAQAASIRDWKLICFCNSRVRTPHFIVTMDDNGAILYAARTGTTREQLRRLGIAATESQLRLMQDWDLLRATGESLRTAFPVLGPESVTMLRTELRELAAGTLPAIRPDVDSVVRLLERRVGLDATYSVVFSYILDGLVWDSLAGGGELVPTEITVEHPFWNGAFWAISSERPNAPGTNAARLDDSTAMLMTWTPGTLPIQRSLQTQSNGTVLARALRRHDPDLLPPVLERFGFFRLDGTQTVATIDERGGDPVPAAARALAGAVARRFRAWLTETDLPRRLSIQDPGLATLILYHEHMWDLVDAFVAAGLLHEPAAIRAAAPTPAEVRPLVTIIFR